VASVGARARSARNVPNASKRFSSSASRSRPWPGPQGRRSRISKNRKWRGTTVNVPLGGTSANIDDSDVSAGWAKPAAPQLRADRRGSPYPPVIARESRSGQGVSLPAFPLKLISVQREDRCLRPGGAAGPVGRACGPAGARPHQQTPLLKHPDYNLLYARFSSDNRWISFTVRAEPNRARIVDGPKPVPESAWITIAEAEAEDWANRWPAAYQEPPSSAGEGIVEAGLSDWLRRLVQSSKFADGQATPAAPRTPPNRLRRNSSGVPKSD